MKAFLSHSSKQKDFVEKVALDLSEIAIIDSKSFEAGLENKDEIIINIDRCNIFVIFLSEEALESPWVKLELDYAKSRLDEGALNRVYPIIIDEKITHNDTRIPSWLKNDYNLKYVARTGKASHLIKRRIQELVWAQHPRIKQRDEVFVGRNNLIQNLEERLDDIQKESPSVLIASGLPKIGRKTLIKNALVKTSSIRTSYIFPTIFLDSRESIEDFIIKVYDLGFSDDLTFPDLINSTLDKKIQICTRLIKDLQNIQETLLVEDNGCIVLHDRSISSWFYQILENWTNAHLDQKITIIIISQYKLKPSITVGYDDIFNVEVSELNKKEKIGLFKRLCDVYEIASINSEDILEISNHLNGFPNQIHYCVELLKNSGITYLKKNFSLLEGFQKEIFNNIIKKIESDRIYKDTLELLVEFDFISAELLIEILPKSYDVGKIVETLDGSSIIEIMGVNKEYLRLNQGVKDYLQRAGYKISNNYKEKLKNHIGSYLESLPANNIGNDISDFFYSLKGALLGDYKFQSKLLLPSHYLKTMISLYEQNKNYKDVILLADRILEREDKLDLGIKHEIKYWLCLALARTKNERLKSEVQFFEGADKNFLLGFFYRINGQADFALEKFYEALNERPRFSRAQREIVTVLNNLGLYDEALDYAEINYENENSNPFHIQAYFDCLIRKPIHQRQLGKIDQLLNELKAINTNKAKEMAAIAQADFELFINRNTREALRILSKSLDEQPSSAYLLNKKFTIHERDKNLHDMEQTMKRYEKVTQSRNNWNESNQLKIMQAKIDAHRGNKNKAFNIISNLSHVPERTKQHLIVTLNSL